MHRIKLFSVLRRSAVLLTASCGLLFAVSCKQVPDTPNGPEENPHVQRLVLNEQILLNETGGPTCTLLIDMDFFPEEAPGQKTPSSALNRAVIEKAFDIKDPISFVMAAALYHDTLQKNYRRDKGELRKAFPEETSSLPFTEEHILNGRILDTGRIYQTYRLEKYDYLGGAHGISSVSYFNFLNGKRIGIAEAFGVSNQEKLGKLLLECLLAEEGVQTASQLAEQGYWVGGNTSITVSENFYCTEDTCYFFYQPYEIAAGYKGIVEIPVPQAKLHETEIR